DTRLILEPRSHKALPCTFPKLNGTVNVPGSFCLVGSFLCEDSTRSSA
ncbi:hypothetical protein A2U01_0084893, partial [Trifolium medium]|nr:hypothetical protein [Trifolium medium]